jgi:hypothetical protein
VHSRGCSNAGGSGGDRSQSKNLLKTWMYSAMITYEAFSEGFFGSGRLQNGMVFLCSLPFFFADQNDESLNLYPFTLVPQSPSYLRSQLMSLMLIVAASSI